MVERRFRDMRLTATEAAEMAQEHWYPGYAAAEDGVWDHFVHRCMKLLPLWRDWGLRDLQEAGRQEGIQDGRWLERTGY